MPLNPEEVPPIASYHAHIYFRTPAERARAETLCDRIAGAFEVKMGRWREVRVGPHAAPMRQIAFAPEIFPRLVPWLMLNRNDLVVLLHPNSGRPRADHQTHAIWFGEVLPIVDPEALAETSGEDETVIPDPRPPVR